MSLSAFVVKNLALEMKDDSHPREAILKHAKVITIRLTTLFSLCLIASFCDFLNVCLSDYRVVCQFFMCDCTSATFYFFCPADCPTDLLTDCLTVSFCDLVFVCFCIASDSKCLNGGQVT